MSTKPEKVRTPVVRTPEQREIIARATSLLMADFGMTEDQAYKRLRRQAMDRRLSILKLSEMLIAADVLMK